MLGCEIEEGPSSYGVPEEKLVVCRLDGKEEFEVPEMEPGKEFWNHDAW